MAERERRVDAADPRYADSIRAYDAVCVEALSDAIKAVEREQVLAVQERFRPAMQRWEELAKDDGLALCLGEDDAEDLRTVLALAEESMHRRDPPKSTAESLQERVEALEMVVQHCHNLAHVALTKGGLEEALENIQITTREALHPHASHCNEEHGGACVPREQDDGRRTMSYERVSDGVLAMLIQSEGTWTAEVTGEKAPTRLALECLRARAAESAEKARADALEADCAAKAKALNALVENDEVANVAPTMLLNAADKALASDAGKRLLEEHAAKVAQLESRLRDQAAATEDNYQRCVNVERDRDEWKEAAVALENRAEDADSTIRALTARQHLTSEEHAAALVAKDARIAELEAEMHCEGCAEPNCMGRKS